ncbi:MAG: anaerobic ribonucleoside-triphosphate reductase, partial [Bacilli bacterium]|nr:anaerobic ribonucleoside-triphosphate reductase [Bacilli bacterium]
ACLNAKWLKKDLTDETAQKFTKEVLNYMREKLSDYQEEYGDLYNLEATPAESTTYRFAKKDKELFSDIITATESNVPFYTNSSHLPVGFTEDIFSALDIQDELQTLYTSGTVFHAFLGERMPDWKAAAALVKKIAENYKLPYYTLSPVYSVCKNHGYFEGEIKTCEKCGEETEVYSRITGYYRPVKNWNDGKSQEYKQRKSYDVLEKNKTLKDKIYLFGTKTCPNCTTAKTLLTKAKIKYEYIDAEENVDLTKEYDVKQAPTLVVIKKGKISHITNVSNIKKFIEEGK